MKKIYLDYAASTPIDPRVIKEMLPYIESYYGNPSSLHKLGISNQKSINEARLSLAKTMNAKPSEIYFCSGGTEATNWAIKGYALANPQKTEIISSKIEHPATLSTCEFLETQNYTIKYLDVDNKGFINLEQLKNSINENTLMVSLIWGNNEIGTIQEIEKISNICQQKNVVLHVDAVQVFGKLAIDLKLVKVDLLTLSAHKIAGPKGIGCLYVRQGMHIEPLVHGGVQEKKMRSGTENLSGIIGFASAAVIAECERENLYNHLSGLTDLLFERISQSFPNAILNGPKLGKSRLPGLLSFSFPDLDGSVLAYELDKYHIYLSTGSACSSTLIEPSHTLRAIKVPKTHIEGTIRLSLGKQTQSEDIPLIINALKKAVAMIT